MRVIFLLHRDSGDLAPASLPSPARSVHRCFKQREGCATTWSGIRTRPTDSGTMVCFQGQQRHNTEGNELMMGLMIPLCPQPMWGLRGLYPHRMSGLRALYPQRMSGSCLQRSRRMPWQVRATLMLVQGICWQAWPTHRCLLRCNRPQLLNQCEESRRRIWSSHHCQVPQLRIRRS